MYLNLRFCAIEETKKELMKIIQQDILFDDVHWQKFSAGINSFEINRQYVVPCSWSFIIGILLRFTGMGEQMGEIMEWMTKGNIDFILKELRSFWFFILRK